MPKKPKTIKATILAAIQQSGESLYRIALDAGLPYSCVHDFVNGKGNLSLDNAEKLCEHFRLELKPRVSKGR